MLEVDRLTEMYADTPEAHRAMWDYCIQRVQARPHLREHRDFVEAGGYGYGDRPFHWVWHALVGAMPSEFKFLEIGVFQGQTLSLIALDARKVNKRAVVYGITPLASDGDKYATHPTLDYVGRIAEIHKAFKLPSPKLMRGASFDPRVQSLACLEGPYDIVYVDGCHDYEVVLDDLRSYAPLVAPGGYLVVDDAGNDLQLPQGMIPTDFFGLPDVTAATAEWRENFAPDFKHLFAVGHLQVFRRDS